MPDLELSMFTSDTIPKSTEEAVRISNLIDEDLKVCLVAKRASVMVLIYVFRRSAVNDRQLGGRR